MLVNIAFHLAYLYFYGIFGYFVFLINTAYRNKREKFYPE